MYIINKKHRKNGPIIIVSFLFLTFFCYFIIAADKYNVEEKNYGVNAAFLEIKGNKDNGYLSLDNVIIFDDINDKLTYIVQPGDNLSMIADNFGTTVGNIKNINGLSSDILRPGQKLIISQEEGILYEMTTTSTIKSFAQKYGLDLEKLKALNYISQDDYSISKGEEIFVPISNEQAKKIGLIKTIAPSTNYQPTQSYTYSDGKSTIIAKWYYKPNISNGFYRGHCTRYVAIKKFPYTDENTQKRLWGGNANEWYKNAKAAGYSVGSEAKVGSIVVLKYGGRYYYSAGHVGIVLEVDNVNNKILIEEMNGIGRFFVTKRWISKDSSIIGYIYY